MGSWKREGVPLGMGLYEGMTCLFIYGGGVLVGAGGPEERSRFASDLRVAGAIPHRDSEERVEPAGRRAFVHTDNFQRAGSGVRAERRADAEVSSVDIREGGVVQVERHAAFVPGGAADKDAASAGGSAGVGAGGEGDSGDAGEAADREGATDQVRCGRGVGMGWKVFGLFGYRICRVPVASWRDG